MYQVYKLIRAVNRQYPNNGFIKYVDIDYSEHDGETIPTDIVDEDLRDIINEALHDIYKDVAVDEIYSFPTVPGQVEYALPDDCYLSDVQEVTRTGFSANQRPLGPIPPIEAIVEGDVPPPIPPPPPGPPYPGWVPHLPWINRHTRRLVWARDAEELTGDRYFNAWGGKKIGIMPIPTTNYDIIKVYYKKKPKDIIYMDDEIQIKDKYMPILKYRVCMELAMSGSNPDIDMYNVFANQYNSLLLEAKREKDADQPYYHHVKDNRRPRDYFRRRPWRGDRW